eukprot:Pgem_evm1s6562
MAMLRPLLSYNDSIPIGNPDDLYMYIYISGVLGTVVLFCFVFFRRQYVNAFKDVWLMLKKREVFQAQALSILFSIPAFLGYSSIMIGDLLNANGKNAN